ncbi:MAG: cytochrome c [Deltaproteobacteria bacterium]|nr:cytochrome c [Deltaproteobacteria bacterium]
MREFVCAVAAVCALAMAAPVVSAEAANGKALFEKKGCTQCHEIGKDLKAPDLKDVTARRSREWIISFIQHPEQHYDDPEIKAYIERYKIKMPPTNLKEPEAETIYEYLKSLHKP